MQPKLTRRAAIGLTVLASAKAVAQDGARFPPLPAWRPSFQPSLETIVDRMHYYFDGRTDFAVFQNGTCVLVDNGLPTPMVAGAAKAVLSAIYNFHPDFNPLNMDDGNVLVGYNHPAYNVVMVELARQNWQEVEARYLDGLAESEVLITPLGQNKFDDFGKLALLGRCYMFMDAQNPQVVLVERARA